jgi:hypothetical protein
MPSLESVVSTFFVGEGESKTMDSDLRAAVEEFNSAVADFGHRVGFKVFDLLQGIFFLIFEIKANENCRCT